MEALFVIFLVILFIALGSAKSKSLNHRSGGTDHSSYYSGSHHSSGCDSGDGGSCGGGGGE
ncbi:hypothetical protein [Pseudalkalibacillus hwajinpoensis]|uniref:hypothetical protein n=1 Tax=Guptibacillus hwajinpoensis TaxID=208199 RepID=UPI001CD6DC8E|nr:hypothetical protein [Pseudalkalibacillus hwajinpoensis]MCA0993805.1 hypothetical protein [Pseudalkalibacillus hwajinpoensis]